jgi:hypothetical protein
MIDVRLFMSDQLITLTRGMFVMGETQDEAYLIDWRIARMSHVYGFRNVKIGDEVMLGVWIKDSTTLDNVDWIIGNTAQLANGKPLYLYTAKYRGYIGKFLCFEQ